MEHKSGFVNIIGNPNVGKSTLMNKLVGERLSIITSKAQTTRHRILGIVNEEQYQIVFSDTPGVIKPSYELQNSMMNFVQSAFQDADVILYMVEINEKGLKDPEIFEKLQRTDVPILVLLNKIDQADQKVVVEKMAFWKEQLPKSEIIPISALENFNTEAVMDRILELLPEGPAYYPKDALTDRPERFFVSEIIREKILIRYKKEIPYSVEIEVESFVEEDELIRMSAIIYVARDSQKGIIIGHKGASIKGVGIDARKEMERFFGKKVFLELFVKVNKNWRESDQQLKRFGYLN